MKLLRLVAALVALADIAFAFYFVASPAAVSGAESAPELARWLAVCLGGSAAALVLVASDAERYFPVAFVDAGVRALAALVGLPAIARQIAVVVSQGALAALLIAAIAYEIKRRREEASVAGRPAAEGKSAPTKA